MILSFDDQWFIDLFTFINKSVWPIFTVSLAACSQRASIDPHHHGFRLFFPKIKTLLSKSYLGLLHILILVTIYQKKIRGLMFWKRFLKWMSSIIFFVNTAKRLMTSFILHSLTFALEPRHWGTNNPKIKAYYLRY